MLWSAAIIVAILFTFVLLASTSKSFSSYCCSNKVNGVVDCFSVSVTANLEHLLLSLALCSGVLALVPIRGRNTSVMGLPGLHDDNLLDMNSLPFR